MPHPGQAPYRAASVLNKPTLEPVARGVWVMRGGISAVTTALSLLRGHLPRRTFNVYLLEDVGGVTLFDAGIEAMTQPLADVAARLGGVKRVVLGHAHPDHRGAAPGIGAPVYCHPDEVAEAEEAGDPDYVDYTTIDHPIGRRLMPRLLRHWDGGPVQVEGTVCEGDDVAGFEVKELPGHAPGQIGLWRESDRLALVSDTIYTVDPVTGRFGRPRVPHEYYSQDRELARQSIRKLAALAPREVWAGHADPVTGDVRAQLEHAAATT